MENNEKRSVQRNVGPNKIQEKPKNFRKSIFKLLRIQQKAKNFLYNSNNIWNSKFSMCNNWTK